jgi:hypothetical protein
MKFRNQGWSLRPAAVIPIMVSALLTMAFSAKNGRITAEIAANLEEI